MLKSYPTQVGLIVLMFILFGCGRGVIDDTFLDKNWGRSFETARETQQLDPDASPTLGPVTGLDGQAAEGDMQKYREAHSKDKKSCGGGGTGILLGTLGGS
jgi:hypothetical protein